MTDDDAGDKASARMDYEAWRPHAAAFALVVAAILAAYWPTWASMVRVWSGSATYAHGFLVAPIAAALIWNDRRAVLAGRPDWDWRAGPAALAFGSIWVVGHAAYVQFFEHVGVVGLVLAAAVGAFGFQAARRAAFPLGFVFFMVPFGDEFIPALQTVTADMTVALMRLFGFAIFRDGVFLQTTSGYFHVAEACAGIRFLIANIVVGALVSHLAFEKAWKHAAFMTLAIVVPIAANGLRAFGIVLIATLTNGEVATGVDHIVYGWGFFAAIMLALIFIGARFEDRPLGAPRAAPAGLPPAPARSKGALARAAAAAVGLVLFVPALYGYGAMDHVGPAEGPLLDRPLAAAQVEAIDDWTPQTPRAEVRATRSYAIDGDVVALHQAAVSRERPGVEIVHYENRAFDAERWSRVETRRIDAVIAGEPVRARLDVLKSGRAQRLALTWYRVDGQVLGAPGPVKVSQAARRLGGRDGPASLFVASVRVPEPEADGERAAQIERFVAALSRLTAKEDR